MSVQCWLFPHHQIVSLPEECKRAEKILFHVKTDQTWMNFIVRVQKIQTSHY